MAVSTFRDAFTQRELINGNVSVIPGQYVKLGEYKVEAGEKIAFGFGQHTGQDNAEGRIYVDLQSDVPAAVDGKVQLVVLSPQNRHLATIAEYRTEQLRTGLNDRPKQVAFPLIPVQASEDRKICLYFDSDTSATVSETNSKLVMDITVQAD